MLILQRPWTEQPQIAEINPRLRAVVDVWSGATPQATLVRKEATVLSGATFSPSSLGMGLNLSAGTQSLRICADQNNLFPNDNAVTIAILRRPRSTADSNTSLFGWNASSSDRLLITAPYSGSIYFDWRNTSGGRVSTSYTKKLQQEALVFTARTSGPKQIWRDGVLIASGTTTASETNSPTSSAVYIGSVASIGSDAEDIALVVVSSEQWTAAEIVAWSANPWGETFADHKIYIPYAAASGGATYTLSASGSVAFSGAVPLLRTRLIPAAGTVILSGTALSARTRAQPASGTVSFSGTAPLSTASSTTYTLTSGGTVTLSGTALQIRDRVFPASGTIGFSGSAPLTNLRVYVLTASGAFQLSGAVPLIRTRLQPVSGQVTFSGAAPISFIPFGSATTSNLRLLLGVGE